MLDAYLQLSHQTAKNRFPKIFATLRELKPDAKRVCSFGCSTGEEALALAEVFPGAEIVGIDIDYYSVHKARRRAKERVFFHTDLGGTGKYDVITVLMVLFSLESAVPKDRWDAVVEQLDRHLNVGGVIAIYTSDYEFAGENYEALRVWKRTHRRNGREYFCGYWRKLK